LTKQIFATIGKKLITILHFPTESQNPTETILSTIAFPRGNRSKPAGFVIHWWLTSDFRNSDHKNCGTDHLLFQTCIRNLYMVVRPPESCKNCIQWTGEFHKNTSLLCEHVSLSSITLSNHMPYMRIFSWHASKRAMPRWNSTGDQFKHKNFDSMQSYFF